MYINNPQNVFYAPTEFLMHVLWHDTWKISSTGLYKANNKYVTEWLLADSNAFYTIVHVWIKEAVINAKGLHYADASKIVC